MSKEHVLIFQAIRSLGIDVPVMRASVIQPSEGRQPEVVLELYGGRVISWSPDSNCPLVSLAEPATIVDPSDDRQAQTPRKRGRPAKSTPKPAA